MTPRPRPYRRATALAWWSLLFLGAGYLPTLLWFRPTVSLVAASLLAIPVGSMAPSVWRGFLRGLGCGALAGVGIWLAMDRIAMTIAAARLAASGPASATSSAAATLPATLPASVPASMPALPPGMAIPPGMVAFVIGSTALMCALVAALFAYLAQRRRRLSDEAWQ